MPSDVRNDSDIVNAYGSIAAPQLPLGRYFLSITCTMAQRRNRADSGRSAGGRAELSRRSGQADGLHRRRELRAADAARRDLPNAAAK